MAEREVGEIRTEVTVTGDVSGQLAVGSNIVQMRVDRVLGNVVTVLPPDARPNVTARPHPLRLVPRRPMAVFDRMDETREAVAELTADRSVALQAPSGMGKSTMVHHLAHHPDVSAAYGAVVCLSARGQSSNDLLQALFEAFYTSDVPVRPTRVQLQHLLQPMHAAVLLDDVDLPDDAVTELQDLAPSCGFVLAGVRSGPWGGARSLPLSGLPVAAAGELLAHVLGQALEPADQGAVYALWGMTRGAPGRLVQLGVNASTYPGPLQSFIEWAAHEGLPPFRVDTPQDRRLLGLLAAVPGVELTAPQLAAVSGVPDTQWRLQHWVERGVLTVTAAGAYGFVDGGELDPTEWELEDRRAELVNYVATWARQQPDTVLVAGGSAEPVRILQETARRRRAWRAVIVLGLLLDVAYALGGRWDAWNASLQSTLEAARALGDQATEAMALHQLGTGALCGGDLATARELLTAALELRMALGQTAAAEVTRHNLATLTTAPAPVGAARDDGGRAGLFAKIPASVKVAAVLVPLLGSLAFVGLSYARGTPTARFEPQRLAFTGQAADQASAPQVIRLSNAGPAELHVDDVAVSGPNHGAFTLVDTTCAGEVPAGGGCTATVVFTPATAGTQQAGVSWRIREIPNDLVSPLIGTGLAAAPTAPTADPDVLTFATQPQGTQSAPQQVRLVAGSAPLHLTAATTQGVQSADFLVDGDGCAGALLAPRADCPVGVRFTPSAAGERSALLTMTDAAGRPVAAVALRGTGAAPPAAALAVTPTALGFGDQVVGTASAGRPVTLTNRGGAPVDLGAATIAGSADFAVTDDDCPARLDSGKACTTTVAFTPSGPGPRTAQLLLAAPGRPSVALRGAGAARPPTLPELAPSALAFGEHAVDIEAAPQVVTVTNRNDAPLRLAGIGIDDVDKAFRIDAAPCTDVTLAPGGSCRIAVRFAPSRAGSFSGVLSAGVQGVPGRASTTFTGTAVQEDVEMPGLVGKPQTEAAARLDALGLRVGQVERRPDPSVAVDAVVACTPRPGTRVPPGSVVDLVVSTGPEHVAVPSVVGAPATQARSMITERKLVVGEVASAPSDTVAEGVVLSSKPAPGELVALGAKIALVVSSGPPMPNVVGMSVGRAAPLLQNAGLQPDFVDADGNPVTDGTVVRSYPAAGRPLPDDRRVRLTVTPPVTPTPTTDPPIEVN